MSLPDLEVRPLRSPEVAEILRAAGIEPPGRPALLVTGAGTPQVLSGWRMRRSLAKIAGWRRSRDITRLLAAEWRARLGKATAGSAPTRRRVIGTLASGVAAAAGSVALTGAASAAVGRSSGAGGSPAGESIAEASPADTRRAMASVPLQRAVRTWGPVNEKVYEAHRDGLSVLVFTHKARDVMTFVQNTKASQGGQPIALSMARSSSRKRAIRYYTVTGTALADVGMAPNGKVQSTPASTTITRADRQTVSPDFNYDCFFLCLGFSVSDSCVFSCIACAGGLVFSCVTCGICAGVAGVSCALAC